VPNCCHQNPHGLNALLQGGLATQGDGARKIALQNPPRNGTVEMGISTVYSLLFERELYSAIPDYPAEQERIQLGGRRFHNELAEKISSYTWSVG
jgi:hypothetical protein